MSENSKDVVETLLDKAVTAKDAVQAMNFAQAACNAANALRALADAKHIRGLTSEDPPHAP